MIFRMQDSVYPDDRMLLGANVTSVETDDAGCGWATLDVSLSVDGQVKTTCEVRVALPADADDNPWERAGDDWRPRPAA